MATALLGDAAPSRVPGLAWCCQLISLPRRALHGSRYCLSFTAASLRPELAAVIAGIHLEQQGDWGRTKVAVLDRNALQARSASTAKRLESELRQRLLTLTATQLELLAKGANNERIAMTWLAALKRIQLAFDVVVEVLAEKMAGMDPVLRRSDMVAFYEVQERIHPELAKVTPSSQQKIRSTLLNMLREAGLLAGQAGKGGVLGTVQRPLLSPDLQELIAADDPIFLAGFLAAQPQRALASSKKKGRAVQR